MKEFFTEFRNDHRQIRDLVMNSIEMINQNRSDKANILLEELNQVAGPHFRFEEESLYPELIPIYGGEYINKLYTDHDLAIARFKKLRSIMTKEELSEEERRSVSSLLRGMLPHLSDCEGLTIMVELFDKKKIDHIFRSMIKARKEQTSLMNWAESERGRKELKIV